jgi:hypothetical protein
MRNETYSVFSDPKIYAALIPFFLGLILKTLLDLNLGKIFVKLFYWISYRGIFRTSANKVSGIYKQSWTFESNSNNYSLVSDRQSLITLKQLNNYCYGEFNSKNGQEKYYLFGEIIDRKIIGHWSDMNSKLNYFGSFELTVINSKKLQGIWIGHSNNNPVEINQHTWTFNAVVPNYKFLVLTQLKIYFRRKKTKKKV